MNQTKIMKIMRYQYNMPTIKNNMLSYERKETIEIVMMNNRVCEPVYKHW